jgi:hypothetical protein
MLSALIVLAGGSNGDELRKSESKVRNDSRDFIDGLTVEYAACSLR